MKILNWDFRTSRWDIIKYFSIEIILIERDLNKHAGVKNKKYNRVYKVMSLKQEMKKIYIGFYYNIWP